jgi:uncharacterized membrane protein YphA (DoxX/SURF4 family)
MGLLFLVAGLGMAMDSAGAAGYFTMLGIPMAGVVVWLAIAVKVIAGGAIVLGKRTTEAAAALIIFTLIATLLAHISPAVDTTFLMAFGPHGTNILGDDPGELPGRTT